ncbi:gustatory and pheromone receptor 39a-like [Anoplophora glabripennis]|uniref:gustatory and pheromone receptor 39a-like n=1 Tax=Anoplophora glabripennis TaxID=217634 RepID=UPI000873EA79|nr:gustatory and pheromone receptor 39a-like [Anoplophora glabripennis]
MALYFVDAPLEKNASKNKFNMYKRAFLRTDQYDVKVIIGLLRCYKFFFVTPFNFEDESNRKLGKYLSIILSLLCVVYMYFSITDSYGLLKDSPITRFLLADLWCIMNMLYLMSCFLNANAFKEETWKTALRSVDQAEYMLRKMSFQSPKKDLILLLQVVLIFVPYVVLTSFQVFLWISGGNMIALYSFVGSYVAYLYMCLFLFFVLRLTGILKARYEFVEDNLKNIAGSKMDDQEKVRKLTEIVRLYKTFMFLMDSINGIFGPHLFFFISVTISYMLCAISYNMDIDAENETAKDSSILSITVTVVYTLSLIVLIISCDGLEASGKKVIKTCYIMHESTESRLVKDHLLQMAQYAEQWRPTLSAAGFYNVNQSTLSAIFEAIITYLVIIIQFNLALA